MSDTKVTAQYITNFLTTAVAELATVATLVNEPPYWYDHSGRYLAVYYLNEVMLKDGPTGSREFTENYAIEYWEPALQDAQNLVVDAGAWDALVDLYEQARNQFLVSGNQVEVEGTSQAVYKLWLAPDTAMGPTLPQDNGKGAFVRGFQLVVQASRFRPFT